jgi:hypothetical protein
VPWETRWFLEILEAANIVKDSLVDGVVSYNWSCM